VRAVPLGEISESVGAVVYAPTFDLPRVIEFQPIVRRGFYGDIGT